MSIKDKLPALLVGAVLIGGVAAMGSKMFTSNEAQSVEVVRPTLSPVAQQGETLFNGTCAACHGQNAAGTDQGPPLIHNIYNPGHHGDAAFYRAAAVGVQSHHWGFGDMPPQPSVTQEDVAKILAYVREVQRANGIAYQQHQM